MPETVPVPVVKDERPLNEGLAEGVQAVLDRARKEGETRQIREIEVEETIRLSERARATLLNEKRACEGGFIFMRERRTGPERRMFCLAVMPGYLRVRFEENGEVVDIERSPGMRIRTQVDRDLAKIRGRIKELVHTVDSFAREMMKQGKSIDYQPFALKKGGSRRL